VCEADGTIDEAMLRLVPRTFDGLKELVAAADKTAHIAKVQAELKKNVEQTWPKTTGSFLWHATNGCANPKELYELLLKRPVEYGEFIRTCNFRNEEDIYEHFVWNMKQVLWAPNSSSTWEFQHEACRAAAAEVLKRK
jgi:hypothetical protein